MLCSCSWRHPGAVLAQGAGAMRVFAAERDAATAARDARAAELAEAAAALAALARAVGCNLDGGQPGSVVDVCRCGESGAPALGSVHVMCAANSVPM